jgi:hypothetical protein
MNDSLATLTRPLAAPPVTRRRARWPWVLLALFVAGLLAVGLVADALDGLKGMAPISVTIDDERVVDGLRFGEMPPAHRVVLATVVIVCALVALLVVPVALILGIAAVLAGALALVGLPLIVVVLVVAVALSPLLLLGWLIWRLAN